MDMTPTRTHGLTRLATFLPHAGGNYARLRNFDLAGHPHVSGLSPYLRHRLLTEDEVLSATLARFSLSSADKFVSEVFWRTYWKGWLEHRPGVWANYKQGVQQALNHVQTASGLRSEWEAACAGKTGIACFDHWAHDLVTTGYLHNHARMWMASIWIFTLRLPWELGADFFLRHLLDGDAASNTLSWRWVAGLHTVGKTYLARPDNIETYTQGRFRPTGLATTAMPLSGQPAPARGPLPTSDRYDPSLRTGHLITDDDLSPGWMLQGAMPAATLNGTPSRSPLHTSQRVQDWTQQAIQDATGRLGLTPTDCKTAHDICTWATNEKLQQIVTSYSPTGPAQDLLTAARPALNNAGIRLVQHIRPFDAAAWPHATAGFFGFKSAIPTLIAHMAKR